MTQNMQASGCPFHQKDGGQTSLASTNNSDWWPNALNLDILSQHEKKTNPMDPDFDYAAAFKSLDLEAVKQDLRELINSIQEWWPSDYGSYIGMFVRTAWHLAGSYRKQDGRGGHCEKNKFANMKRLKRILIIVYLKFVKTKARCFFVIMTVRKLTFS